jgi:carbohydrate-binding DOMON domain-containing protein
LFSISAKEKIIEIVPKTETFTMTETTTTVTREERIIQQMAKPEFVTPLEPEIYVRERGIAR